MRDWLSHSGAQALASLIRAYWADRGIQVSTTVEPARPPGNGHVPGVWAVRSALTGREPDNGPPRVREVA